MGTALEGATDPANALKMTEEISEEVYTWYGVMKEGDYKFILNTTGQSSSYTQVPTAVWSLMSMKPVMKPPLPLIKQDFMC
mgnify:CR=1 FL=1